VETKLWKIGEVASGLCLDFRIKLEQDPRPYRQTSVQ
jgi:hypothetical protein